MFVDASFEKSWLVTNRIREASFASFDPTGDIGLPLLCLGTSDQTPDDMGEDETCEVWLGPLGERVFWIRPKDARLYWYMGGNPRSTKSRPSSAYFFFSSQSGKDSRVPWLSFRDAFKGHDVKKVICSRVDGANPRDIGFSEPDERDLKRMAHFLENCQRSESNNIRFAVNTKFDHRFLAKLAIGISYCRFGRVALTTPYAEELYKTLWQPEHDTPILIQGSTPLTTQADPKFLELIGERYAVTLLILPSPDGILLNLNLGARLNWTIKCASIEGIDSAAIQALGYGRIIFLYRQLQWGVEMALEDYVAHKTGSIPNADLTALGQRIRPFDDYIAGLS